MTGFSIEHLHPYLIRLRKPLMVLWAGSFVAPFLLFSWWAALLVLVLLFLAPGAFLAVALTKHDFLHLGATWSALLEGFIEGCTLVLVVAMIDTFTRLGFEPLATTSAAVWLYTVNQTVRAAKPSGNPKEELVPLPGFLVGTFVGFNIWLFVITPLMYA